MKRFELSTLSLARRCSTTELHPQVEARVATLATWKACITEVPLVKRVDKTRHISPKTAKSPSNEGVPKPSTSEPPSPASGAATLEVLLNVVHSIEKTGLERAKTAHGQLKNGEANIKIYYKLSTKTNSCVKQTY